MSRFTESIDKVKRQTGIKGVFFDKSRNKWKVHITFKKKRYRFGNFDTEDEANKAALAKRLELGCNGKAQVKARFEDDKFTINEETGCWEWHRGLSKSGRGVFSFKGLHRSAPRVSYYLYHGVDPGHQHVRQHCGNSLCVNPAHLSLCVYGDTQSKLTGEEAQSILDSDKPRKVLAAEYGVHILTVRDIKLGHTWKHLKGDRDKLKPTGRPRLRLVQQVRTNTGVVGVYCSSDGRGYQAEFGFKGERYYIGHFNNINDAELALIVKRMQVGAPAKVNPARYLPISI